MGTNSAITSVITGDIIQSRQTAVSLWLPRLKKALSAEGKSPRTWQIYRGDSFQMEVKNPTKVLLAAIRVKASIKTFKDIDVRMAIGIGKKNATRQNITESDGEAFVHSGETFETLKKTKRNLVIKTPWENFDRDMNIFLQLVSIPMDDWSPGSAELVGLLIEKKNLTQRALAKKLGLTQPSVSERQNRSHFETIMALESLYSEKIHALISSR